MSLSFPILECPGLVRKAADGFKDLVGSKYRELTATLCAAVMGFEKFSDMARFLMFSRSVSSLSRFFDTPELAGKLSRRHRRRVLRLVKGLNENPQRYLWAIDDTFIARGEKVWGSYYWYDHSNESFRDGHKLLVVGIVDRHRRLFIPVIWEVLHRKTEINKHTYEKATEIVLRLLNHAIHCGFPKLPVVGDSWFAGETLYQGLQDLGFDFVFEIKCYRNINRHNGKVIERIRADNFFQTKTRHQIRYHHRSHYAAEAVIQFYRSKVTLKAVAVATKPQLDLKAFSIYVSNRLTWNASKVWGISRERWAIEVQFRELKSIFTLGEAAVRSQNSVETAVTIAMIALTVIRLEQLSQVDTEEDQHFRPKPAGAIVRELQVKSLARGISKLALQPSSAALDKLRRRLNYENLNRKPAERRRLILSHAQLPSWRSAA